jgi:hypothetical protein
LLISTFSLYLLFKMIDWPMWSGLTYRSFWFNFF